MSCVVKIMGDHPQNLKILMIDRVEYWEGKVKKRLGERDLKKNWNLMLTNSCSFYKSDNVPFV